MKTQDILIIAAAGAAGIFLAKRSKAAAVGAFHNSDFEELQGYGNVKAAYKFLEKHVVTLRNINNNDDYFVKMEDVKNKLQYFLSIYSDELYKLTSKEVINVVAWCSSYRPMALHSILINLGKSSKYH